MDMLALADGGRDSTDIFAVFHDRVPGSEIAQGDLMPDGHILDHGGAKFTVVLCNDAQHVGSGGEVFNDHDPDVVAVIVHEQMRVVCHGYLPPPASKPCARSHISSNGGHCSSDRSPEPSPVPCHPCANT